MLFSSFSLWCFFSSFSLWQYFWNVLQRTYSVLIMKESMQKKNFFKKKILIRISSIFPPSRSLSRLCKLWIHCKNLFLNQILKYAWKAHYKSDSLIWCYSLSSTLTISHWWPYKAILCAWRPSEASMQIEYIHFKLFLLDTASENRKARNKKKKNVEKN